MFEYTEALLVGVNHSLLAHSMFERTAVQVLRGGFALSVHPLFEHTEAVVLHVNHSLLAHPMFERTVAVVLTAKPASGGPHLLRPTGRCNHWMGSLNSCST